MFTLRRIAVAPRVCGAVPATTIPSAVSIPTIACQRNRRYSSSSSKPSNPSDGARSPSSSSGTTTNGIAAAAATMKRSGRAGLKTVRAATGMKEGTKIPVVPSTDHLHPADVAISTFFAQHRPVSISHVVPLSYSETSFDSIFARRKLSPIHDSAASSIAADFEALESAASSGGLEPNVHSSPVPGEQNTSSPIQLPQHLLQLGKRYMPFCPPPVPAPQTAFVRPAKVFANRTDMPMERIMIRQPIKEEPESGEGNEMVEPQGENRGTMQALSVKRRRGLRMKKHKLKKLRKRTRSLRRRIESHSK